MEELNVPKLKFAIPNWPVLSHVLITEPCVQSCGKMDGIDNPRSFQTQEGVWQTRLKVHDQKSLRGLEK